MKKILIVIVSLLSTLNAISQANVNWEWYNQSSVLYLDMEYKNGYIYAVGQFTDSAVTVGGNTFVNQGGSDIVIAKLDTFGNVIWANAYGSSGNDYVSKMTVDINGNIYVTGSFISPLPLGNNTLYTAGGWDIYMIKLDNAGSLLLARQVGDFNNDFAKGIAADNAGNSYLIVNSGGIHFAGLTSPANARSVVKFDNAGNESNIKWLTGVGASPSTYYQLESIAYSQFDNAIILGGVFNVGSIRYYGGVGNITNNGMDPCQDIFLIRTDTALNTLYKKNVTQSYSKTNILRDMCTGDNGKVYVAQWYGYSLNGYSDNFWNEFGIDLGAMLSAIAVGTGEQYLNYGDQHIFYDNNMLYGVIYQPSGPSNCTNSYAMKWNLTNFSTSYLLLNTGIGGVAGHNGNYYLGNWGIGKTCEVNCNTPVQNYKFPDVAMCLGANINIGYSCFYAQGGNPPYTYSWAPATGLNNTNIASPEVSGITANTTYTVTITEQNNNIVYDTVTVSVDTTLSNANITSQFPAICDSMQLYSNNGIAGNWYKNLLNNQWQLIANDTTITIYSTGKYKYEKSNACNAVSDSIIVTGTVTVTASASSDSVCAGQSVTLNGAGALTYTWTNGVTNNVPFNSITTQTYVVTGTDASGCSNTSSIVITINNSFDTTNTSICPPQVPYVWNGQTLDSSGTYSATFTNIYGCDSVETLNLTVSPCIVCVPNITINYSPYYYALTESQSWILTSGTVLVLAGSNVKLDAQANSYVTLNPGFKAEHGSVFIAQAYNGCTAGAPQLPQTGKVFKEDPFASNEIVLYPNPTSGMIHIKHDEKLSGIQIFDMVGKLVIDQKCAGETGTDIDLSNQPDGVYHVKVLGYNSIKVIKNN